MLNNENKNVQNCFVPVKEASLKEQKQLSGYNIRVFGKDASNIPVMK